MAGALMLPAQIYANADYYLGRKRAAEDAEPRETRSSKATKIETNATKPSSSKAGGKKGAKAASTAPPASEFKKQAMPLHVNITHTPMSVSSEATDDVPAAPADPGFIGSATLVPTTFSTGSYGWKGNKRVEVELEGGEGKKVKVMLT